MRLKNLAWLALFGALVPGIAMGQSGTVTDDAFASSNSTTQLLNLKGQGISLIVAGSSAAVGSTSVGLTKSYIKFQLSSSLPPNVAAANVQKATLKLFVSPSCSPTGAIDIYPVTSAWTESTLSPSSPPTVATSPFASDVLVGADMTYVVVDITQIVQDWIEGPSNGGLTNDGIALIAHTSSTYAVFDSKESIVTSHEPRLEIVLANTGGQGPAGPQGPVGAQGPQGAAGAAGAPGAAASVQVGTTMTVAAGTPASVLNGGTANAAVLNFLIPQGPAGISNRGQWNATNAYNANDAVSDQGSFWLALQAIPGSTPNSEPSLTNANWQLLAGGIVNRGTWSASNNYNVNDAVSDSGSFWLALVPTSATAIPPTSCEPSGGTCAADWQLLAAQGSQGTTGPAGPQGPQGIQGLMGFQGPPGVPPPNSAATNVNNNFTAPQTVGGNVSITGAGNGLVFPDGSVQTTAATSGGSGGGTISCSTFEISSSSPIAPAGYTSLSQITAGNVWFTVAPIPTARSFLAGASLNGKIYAIGGADNSGNVLSTVEVYDPSTNTWSTAAPMPTPRSDLAAVAANGKIYAIGGFPTVGNVLNTVEVYDPSTNTWSTAAPLVSGRADFAAASVNGKVYAFGGGGSIVTPSSFEVYDPSTNSWGIFNLIPGVSLLAGVSVNGKIYIPGDLQGIYDPSANSFTALPPIPGGTVTAAFDEVASVNGKIYVISASNANVETYDPSTSSWSAAAPLPFFVGAAAAADANGLMYVFGGTIGGTNANVALQYSPPVTIYTFIKN